jgi:hypothetical protein
MKYNKQEKKKRIQASLNYYKDEFIRKNIQKN